MNITILIGSPRHNGNTATLAESFAAGAMSAGHKVTSLWVSNLSIAPCCSCNQCHDTPDKCCVVSDDMRGVYSQLSQTDVLVLASPVYFYGISAQLKTLIDRLHAPVRDSFTISKLVLLSVGGASLPELFNAIEAQYQLALNYFHFTDGGRVLVHSMRNGSDIQGHPALQTAYQIGVRIADNGTGTRVVY